MGTRFHLESWRKLYTNLPPSWLAMPVSARGLGDELLKYVDETGLFAIKQGRPMVSEVCRIISAHAKERGRISDDLTELLDDGYLLLVPEGLRIKNFVVAQGRSPSAVRMARLRERQRHSDASSDVTSDAPVRARSDGSDETRPDPTRREIPEAPSASPPVEPKPAKPKVDRKRASTRQPDEGVDEWLTTLGLPLRSDPDWGREVGKWLDHHRAKDNRFADWAASWRTWKANADRFGNGPRPEPVQRSLGYQATEERKRAAFNAEREAAKAKEREANGTSVEEVPW